MSPMTERSSDDPGVARNPLIVDALHDELGRRASALSEAGVLSLIKSQRPVGLLLGSRYIEDVSSDKLVDVIAGERLRLQRYQVLRSTIEAVAPTAYDLKGLSLAALYPRGLLRSMSDLDIVAADIAQLWTIGATLGREGFAPHALTAVRQSGRLEIVVSFVQVDPDRNESVEVSTVPLAAGLVAFPRLHSSFPGRARLRHLAAILDERFERPFHLRDAVDLILLLAAPVPEEEVQTLLAVTRLSPEYRALWRLATVTFPFCHAVLPLPDRRLEALELAQRGAMQIAALRHPARWIRRLLLNRRLSSDRLGWLAARGWQWARRVSTEAALAEGLPVFGIRTDSALEDRIKRANGDAVDWLDTPLGRFVLVFSDALEVDG